MLSKQIKSKIDSLWDKFWSGGIANPLTAIEQISYLLFMKRLDEIDLKNVSDAKFLDQDYKSVFSGKDEDGEPNENKRWSHFKHLEAGEMLQYVQTKVFPFIKTLNKDSQQFSKHMKDAVFIIPKASLLVEAVSIIDEIYELIESETDNKHTFADVQGDIYEELLSQLSSSGKNGQFRTPRHIINMMCEIIDPKLGEKICDPACGTAGFLLGAYHHILKQHTSENLLAEDENGIVRGLVGDKLTDDRQWEVLKERTFYGYDFDTTMVRIALMNLMLHGIDNPQIQYKDTLSKKFDEENLYDVVLANPPFKGSIDKSDINESLSLTTTKTELLFVNRIFNLLRLGGRAAVIVPDGVLFGSSNAHKDLRKMLLEKAELQAVISMPSGVFKPYAGVSTAILVFVKGGVTENVWFYDMQADGYSLDDKRDKVSENDIPDVIEKWQTRNKAETADIRHTSFFVTAEKIKLNNYDLSITSYKDINYEQKVYKDPETLLDEIIELEDTISQCLEDLRE